MDIRVLRYFIKLSECLNFTHAAKEFYITQTAMSQNIARLEEELGFALFKRNNRNVELTTAGRYFYGQMYTLIEHYDSAVQNAVNLAEGREGQVKIAVQSHMDGLFLMNRLREFRKAYPSMDIRLQTVEPRIIEQELKKGRQDMVMCWTTSWDRTDPELEMLDIGCHPVCAMVRRDHVLAGRGTVSLEELRGEELSFVELRGGLLKNRSITDMMIPGGTASLHVTRKNTLEELLLELELNNSVALLPGFVKQHVPADADVKTLSITGEHAGAIYQTLLYMKQNNSPTLFRLIELCKSYEPEKLGIERT